MINCTLLIKKIFLMIEKFEILLILNHVSKIVCLMTFSIKIYPTL